MRKRPIGWFFFLLVPVLLLGAGPIEVIDDTAQALADFVTRQIPDEPDQFLSLGPLTSDVGGRTLLGERLKSALELELAGRYRRSVLMAEPREENHFLLSGELQIFSGRVRVLMRIYGPNGALVGGTRVDLALDEELERLLVPPGGAGLPSAGEGLSDAGGVDPYEEEEIRGGGLEVTAADGPARFRRYLTPGDIDRFRFELADPGTVVLAATSDLDLQLLLFPEGKEIPLMVQASRIEASLARGAYMLEISAYDFNTEGPYEIVLDLGGAGNDLYEPDNTLAEANSILAGESQNRMLLSGDTDWVELRFSIPGFYTVFTRRSQAGLRLVLTDERGREVLAAEPAGSSLDPRLAVFLGNRRLFVRVEGIEQAAAGAYELVMEKFEPLPIYPNGVARELGPDVGTVYLKLRIWQAGQYRITTQGGPGSGLELYELPDLRRREPLAAPGRSGLFTLASGDYLLAVRGDGSQRFRVCVSPAGSPEGCR